MECNDNWLQNFMQKAYENEESKPKVQKQSFMIAEKPEMLPVSDTAQFLSFVMTVGSHMHEIYDVFREWQAQQEKNFIVVFGGRDKLGKTTVANIICEQFPELGFSYKKFPNPDSFSGQQLRLILQGKLPFEAASFQALNFVDKLLSPLQGRLIVDRYTESADVFAKADDLPVVWVDTLNDRLQQPDLTFIFTGEPFGTDGEHYDGNNKIAEGYTNYLERNKDNERVIEIKANKPLDETVIEIIEHIKRFDKR